MMTPPERMVWAAAFARRVGEADQGGLPLDEVVELATGAALRAVTLLRAARDWNGEGDDITRRSKALAAEFLDEDG